MDMTIEIEIDDLMGEEEYRSIKAANASMLKIMHAQSPRHVRYALDHPSEPTAAMKIGSALHCKILRPQDFASEFLVSEKCSAGNCAHPGKKVKDGAWVCGVHGRGVDEPALPVLTPEEMQMIAAMEESAMSHARCREILTGLQSARAESVIQWTDPVVGVPCKAKVDLWGFMDGLPKVADLKSCMDASDEEFSRQIANMGYALQAAFYLDGLSIVNGGQLFENFQFIAIEKTPPYVCCTWHLHQEDIALGRAQYRSALEKWKVCEELGVWPGYSGGMIHVPQSYFRSQMTKV